MDLWKEQSVTIGSIPLPAGASTEAKQDTGNSSLSAINTAIGAKSDSAASSDTGTFSLIALTKRLLEKLTSIISVKITDGAGTANTKQLGTQLTGSEVGLVTNTIVHGLTTGGGGGYVDVKVTPSGALTVESTISNFPAVQPVSDNGGSLTVDAVSLPLPAGASTSALQSTANSSLSSIDSKLTAPLAISDNGGSLTIDGSVSVSNFPSSQNVIITSTVETEIKNDSGNPIPISASTLPLPDGAATSANQTTANNSLISIDSKLTSPLSISLANTVNTDASARLRVSQFTTLGDLKILNEDDDLLLENVGTGTGTFSGNKYQMSVTSGQYIIRKSKQYYHYFSGKSQAVEITFDEFQSEANVLKRVGYFSSNAAAPYNSNLDGVYLENTGSTIDLVIVRNGTETLRQNITAWDGYSSISSYDWSKFTVVLIDFLWLGGAVLRLFLKNPNGGFTLCHTFNYAGSQSDVFMLSPNQSVRYEIRSTTGTGSLHYICAQIATEGSTTEAGKRRSVNTGSTGIAFATVGTTYPVKAIRKKTLHRDRAVKVTGAQLFVSSNSDIALVTIQLNPALSAGLTYSAVSNSAVEEASGNGTITVTSKGAILFSIIVTQNTVMNEDIFEEDFLSHLGMSIADVSDQIVLCITPITSGITAYGCMQYKEY